MTVAFRRAAVCAAFALAAAPAFTTPAVAASPDAQFAMSAAQGGLAEVQAAQLALQKSRNATVQAFAQHMQTAHTANNAQLAGIMRSEGLTVPTTVDPNSQKMLSRLQGLSGRRFDRAYITGQVRAHQAMQILMQSEANKGKDPKLVAYAKTTLSAVNEHLSMAKADAQQLRGRRGGGTMGASMRGGAMGGPGSSGGTMSSPMPMSSAMPMPAGTGTPMSSPMPASSMRPM